MDFSAFETFGLMGDERARSGDPTLLTALNSATMFTTVREGAQLDFPNRIAIAPGFYREIAADVPPLFPVDVVGAKFLAYLPQAGAVQRNTHSNDLTNADYVKTGCTAELALGGLKHGADWRGAELWVSPTLNDAVGSHPVEIEPGKYLIEATASVIQTSAAISTLIVGTPYILRVLVEDGPKYPPGRVRALCGGINVTGGTVTASAELQSFIFIPTNATITLSSPTNVRDAIISQISIREVDVHSRAVATAANATVTKTITRASALRGTKVIGRATGVVRASQGAVGGGDIVTNGGPFTDTTGWVSFGGGTFAVVSSKLEVTGVAALNTGAYFTLPPLVIGKRYRFSVDLTLGTASVCDIAVSTLTTGGSAGQPGSLIFGNTSATYVRYMAASTTTASVQVFTRGDGLTASVDNITLEEIAETTIPTTFTELDLPPYTGANPQLAFRFDDGAILELYDLPHEELAAGVPMFRNFRPIAGVSETVGPFSSGNTIASPATINITALVQAPPAGARDYVVATWYTAADTNVRLQALFNAGNLILRLGASTDVTIASAIAAGATCLIDVQYTGTDIRARLNQAAWATHTHAAIPAYDRFRLGSDHTPANHLQAEFAALWDRDGAQGLPRNGWNHSAITRFEGSL